jgi:Flp pilus assembly protein TadD
VLGQNVPAERALLEALRLEPGDPRIAYALAVFYSKAGRHDRAVLWGEKLVELSPGDPQAMRLLEALRAKR